MCGIACFSGSQAVDKTKYRWLLKENESRGKDSTGVFTLKRDKEKTQTLYKSLASATYFINHPPLKESLSGAVAIIGHTRAASVGAVTQANSHPFVFGEGEDLVVGLHNGFIIPQLIEKHTKDFGFDKEFLVDSQLIFAHLSNNKGDYNCLSDIEGALTIAWMMPNKYGERVFLYRRTPRELHIGFAKEGIYVSSEDKPLTLISCDSIWPLENNQLAVLHNGTLEDIIRLKPPKIDSMNEWASLAYWELNVPEDEYKDLVPELVKKKWKPVNQQKDFFDDAVSDESRAFVEKINSESEFGILMADIKTELEKLEVKPIAVADSTDSEFLDIGESSVVVIKLIDSVHKNPLPGFTIIDKKVEDAEGITTLMGLTVLKYEKRHCGKDHELIVYDPVDETQPYSFNIKPIEGRIVEVVLELPFPQAEEAPANNSTDFASAGLSLHLRRVGDNRFGLLFPPNAKNTLRLVAKHDDDDVFRTEPKSADGTSTEGKTNDPRIPVSPVDVVTIAGKVSRGQEFAGFLNKTEAISYLSLHGMRAKEYKTPRVDFTMIRKRLADLWDPELKCFMTFTLIWDAALLGEWFKGGLVAQDVDYLFQIARCARWLLIHRPHFYVKTKLMIDGGSFSDEVILENVNKFFERPKQLITLDQGVGAYV